MIISRRHLGKLTIERKFLNLIDKEHLWKTIFHITLNCENLTAFPPRLIRAGLSLSLILFNTALGS